MWFFARAALVAGPAVSLLSGELRCHRDLSLQILVPEHQEELHSCRRAGWDPRCCVPLPLNNFLEFGCLGSLRVFCACCVCFFKLVKPQLPFARPPRCVHKQPLWGESSGSCPEHVEDVIWGGMFCSTCQGAAGSLGWGAWLGCS